VLRAVLDTQVILRGAAAARATITSKIWEAWDAGRFTLLLSRDILGEIEDVVTRPEVQRRLRMTPIEAAALAEIDGIPIIDIPTFWKQLTGSQA